MYPKAGNVLRSHVNRDAAGPRINRDSERTEGVQFRDEFRELAAGRDFNKHNRFYSDAANSDVALFGSLAGPLGYCGRNQRPHALISSGELVTGNGFPALSSIRSPTELAAALRQAVQGRAEKVFGFGRMSSTTTDNLVIQLPTTAKMFGIRGRLAVNWNDFTPGAYTVEFGPRGYVAAATTPYMQVIIYPDKAQANPVDFMLLAVSDNGGQGSPVPSDGCDVRIYNSGNTAGYPADVIPNVTTCTIETLNARDINWIARL